MTKEQLGHFRRVLEDMRNELIPRINQEQRLAQEGSGGAGDVGDASIDTLITDTALSLGTRESDLFYQVEQALVRLDRGLYGQCDACGGEIDPRRLEANPVAITCTECAAKSETKLPPPTL